MNSFDEFFEKVGTELKDAGWWIYYNDRGWMNGIEAPHGLEPGTTNHYRVIKKSRDLYRFLKQHGRGEYLYDKIMAKSHRPPQKAGRARLR